VVLERIRQNKTSLIIAGVVFLSLTSFSLSKIYNAQQAKHAGDITSEAAATEKLPPALEVLAEATPVATPKTSTYIVKEGDYLEKIVTNACGNSGGWVDTPLRNKDRILVGQELIVVCN
jgi:LysM repeat protein